MRGEPALQLMGALHRLVLEGRAPELARFYPSTGGTPDAPAARQALIDTVEQYHDVLPGLMQRPIQTNEVGRSAALLVGFLTVARQTGLPLRVLEIGASAGLNLRWDHYRYTGPAGEWGDPDSPVEIAEAFTGQRPPLDLRPSVVERRGCDPHPLDPASGGHPPHPPLVYVAGPTAAVHAVACGARLRPIDAGRGRAGGCRRMAGGHVGRACARRRDRRVPLRRAAVPGRGWDRGVVAHARRGRRARRARRATGVAEPRGRSRSGRGAADDAGPAPRRSCSPTPASTGRR